MGFTNASMRLFDTLYELCPVTGEGGYIPPCGELPFEGGGDEGLRLFHDIEEVTP